MNNLRSFVRRVPEDTREVIKDLAQCCNVSENAIRTAMSNPKRDMRATTAILAIQYFNRYFPCSIEDLIIVDDGAIARRAKLVKPKSPEPGMIRRHRRQIA